MLQVIILAFMNKLMVIIMTVYYGFVYEINYNERLNMTVKMRKIHQL